MPDDEESAGLPRTILALDLVLPTLLPEIRRVAGPIQRMKRSQTALDDLAEKAAWKRPEKDALSEEQLDRFFAVRQRVDAARLDCMAAARGVRMTTDLRDPDAVPYFLWDDPMTLSELRGRLREAPEPERILLLARILREARDTEAWRFTSPEEVVRLRPRLSLHLGRRRAFWEFLLGRWRDQGFVDAR